jgi:hypothetical protein
MCAILYAYWDHFISRGNIRTGFAHTQIKDRSFEIMNINIKSWTLYQKRLRL